ncbi:hypothetical protein ACE1SV_53950 [Streptomyces sp. E-15]
MVVAVAGVVPVVPVRVLVVLVRVLVVLVRLVVLRHGGRPLVRVPPGCDGTPAGGHFCCRYGKTGCRTVRRGPARAGRAPAGSVGQDSGG